MVIQMINFTITGPSNNSPQTKTPFKTQIRSKNIRKILFNEITSNRLSCYHSKDTMSTRTHRNEEIHTLKSLKTPIDTHSVLKKKFLNIATGASTFDFKLNK